MRRVAALDCGTNTLRLLVADLDPATGTAHELLRRSEIVRLGQGVDRTGVLAPEALARTGRVLDTYAAHVRDAGVQTDAVRLVATSATRDARNRDDFTTLVRSALGVDPQVVSGQEEAGLAFAGATRELLDGDWPTPYLVVDIGGGSTELVLGGRDVEAARSVDVGSVRLTERHLGAGPPSVEAVEAAERDVGLALDEVARVVPLARAETVVVVAGTATTVTALALGLEAYDGQRVHHARVTRQQVEDVTAQLLRSTREQIGALGPVAPGRVDVIAAGALVLRAVLRRVGAGSCIASEKDILDGIAWSLSTGSSGAAGQARMGS